MHDDVTLKTYQGKPAKSDQWLVKGQQIIPITSRITSADNDHLKAIKTSTLIDFSFKLIPEHSNGLAVTHIAWSNAGNPIWQIPGKILYTLIGIWSSM